MNEKMNEKKTFKRKLEGFVVSDKMAKTIVVRVTRRFKHPTYRKFVNKRKKYYAHDEKDLAKVGDMVTIIESRPYSALKRWELLTVRGSAP